MSIPWCGKIGKGKFPQSSLKAHFIFPSHGLAVMVKKNFPSRGFAAPGEIFVSPVAAPPLLGKLFFTNPAKPFLGKIKCAFRDSWGNFYFPFPIFPHHGIGPFAWILQVVKVRCFQFYLIKCPLKILPFIQGIIKYAQFSCILYFAQFSSIFFLLFFLGGSPVTHFP